MVQEMQAVRVSRKIQATARAAYDAFATDMTLRQWFTDHAYVQNRDQGKLFLQWDSGLTVTGAYEVRDEGKQIAFLWQALGEPAVSRVQVDFEQTGDNTTVTVAHEGAPSPEEVEKLWTSGLENLQSVLETGNDLRITRRPMLGILPNIFEEEYAKKLGLEKAEGILIGGLVDGMGAQAAGLLKDDVIFKLGGKDTRDFQGLVASLQGKHAGDTVEVDYWRDGKLHAVPMKLSGRVLPDVPPTAAGLADEVEKIYAQIAADLDELLKGLSEAEASKRPGENEWSVKEVVAHLVMSERGEQYFLGSLVNGDEPLAGPGNLPAIYKAFLSVYPTLADVREAFRKAQAETLAFIRELPDQFVAKTPTYTRAGQALLQVALHPNLHFEQIRAAIEAVRQ